MIFFTLQEKEKTLQIIDLQGLMMGWRVGLELSNYTFLNFVISLNC